MEYMYKCDYCNYYDTEEGIIKHEIKCLCNPEKKACPSCKYYNWNFKCNKNKWLGIFPRKLSMYNSNCIHWRWNDGIK